MSQVPTPMSGPVQPGQAQIITTGRHPVIFGNIYTGPIYSPQAYKRQRIIAICIPVLFLILGVACFALGITIMGAAFIGMAFLFFLFAFVIIRRSRRREQLQSEQMAVYNQSSVQPASQFYPSQQYPSQFPTHTSAPPHPPQNYNFQSSIPMQQVQTQQFNQPQNMQPGPYTAAAPPSYDEAMNNQNK